MLPVPTGGSPMLTHIVHNSDRLCTFLDQLNLPFWQPHGAFLGRWAIQQAQRAGDSKVIYVNLDDSLAAKHKDTRHLEGVDWHHDHIESTKHKPRYKKGLCYLACTLAVGT